MQHRTALRFLHQGSELRSQLNQFITGVALAALSDLCIAVLELMLIPCVERSMEQRHAMVNLWLGGKRKKGASVVSL